MRLPKGWRFQDLTDPADRPALRQLYHNAADYVFLETGLGPDKTSIDGYFSSAPPGGDPAQCEKIGVFDDLGQLQGIGDQSYGYPNPRSAYIGLIMLAPDARRKGVGTALFHLLRDKALARGSSEVFVAVLEPNAKGRAFWDRMGFRHEMTTAPITTGAATHVRHRLRLEL